eukprot:TRINITY_DN3769_c0_g1_i2.p1 TRINITY_DN3769_c0_g1~~TRINITY_DN3769_c0_g1_i2.p1  ORF type:complete len:218 (-),score=52.79 TRINITY_DN3769_c0_g1_i2:180-782(-)
MASQEENGNEWSSYALILIDIQKDFWSSIPVVQQSFPGFDDRVAKLLSIARKEGIEVIHVRAEYSTDLSISPWAEYWAELNPEKKTKVVETPEEFSKEIEGEVVVLKNSFDAFLNTSLDSILKSKSKKNLIFCGLVTSCCVLLSTSGAFLRGYRTVVVKDACGDRTVEKHNTIFDIYGAYMFRPSSVETLVEDLRKWRVK